MAPAPAAAAAPAHRPPPLAVARTGPASGVGFTIATLRGTVTLRGQRVRHWFQYGASLAYPAHSHSRVSRSTRGQLAVADRVYGLPASATIHYRLVASTCGGCRSGTAFGPDRTLQTGGYENPVVHSMEGADPSLLTGSGPGAGYWAYVTGDGFPALHSTDLVHWTPSGTTLHRPRWVVPTGDWHPWAPDVHQVAGACPGTRSPYCEVMYYVGLNAKLNANCVAVAVSTSPTGPFRDLGPLGPAGAGGVPIGCGDGLGIGAIDPSYFLDRANGASYLYVSEDFACPATPSRCTRSTAHLQPTVSVIPLAPGGLTASALRRPLFGGQAGTWEAVGVAAPTVEGPAVAQHNGLYYLLYSGGSWRGAYGEGYAVATSPLGPFVKSPLNPELRSGHGVTGVGGSDAPVRGPHGRWWVLYHGRGGSTADLRALRLDPFSWFAVPRQGDAAVIWGPTADAVPAWP